MACWASAAVGAERIWADLPPRTGAGLGAGLEVGAAGGPLGAALGTEVLGIDLSTLYRREKQRP